MSVITVKIAGGMDPWLLKSEDEIDHEARNLIHHANESGQWRHIVTNLFCMERALSEKEVARLLQEEAEEKA